MARARSLALPALLLLIGLPLAANEYLRFTYQQTLAHWLAKIRRPDAVFIGDSITAAGRAFGRLDTINLGANGLTTVQIANNLPAAKALDPRRIYVMAGTNDVVQDTLDPARLHALWHVLDADPRVVVTLSPHTRDAAFNRKIDTIDAIAAEEACRAGRPFYRLSALDGPDGLLRSDYTTDGTHPTASAIAIWRDLLADPRAAETCPAPHRV